MKNTTTDLTAQDLFAMAVVQAASKALTTYPDDTDVITKAVALVTSGAVRLHGTGHLHEVRSASGTGKVYAVNGTCTCPDTMYRGTTRCKHRYSVSILKHALATLQTQAEADNQARDAWSATTGQPPLPYQPCREHGRILARRNSPTGPVWGHVDRARRFTPCLA
jgi:hypothetical protein